MSPAVTLAATGGWAQVLLGGILAFAEAMLGVGIVLPGEVLVTGVATAVDGGWRWALFVAVTLGATLGDHLNYWLGRGLGARLGGSRLVARIGVRHWDRATTLVRRHGAWALVVSRLLPVVRTLMAAVAGASGMRYRSFAAASLVGSALWAGAWIAAGDAVGRLVDRPVLLVPVGVLALVGLGVARCRRRRPSGRRGSEVVPLRACRAEATAGPSRRTGPGEDAA